MQVQGFVADEFAKVGEVVRATPAPFGRGGGGISVYAGGELVVDLWGGWAAPGRPWSESTRAPIASISKSWAAAVVHRLIEQEVLDLTTPICTWWPEFAAHGKEQITLREVLVHSAGVLGFDGQQRLLSGDGWGDYDAIASALAASKPWWTPGSQHGYHAVSYGWLLNEVVRRTTGRTIGDIFRTDFAAPLKLEASLGTTGADFGDVAEVLTADVGSMPALQRWMFNKASAAGHDPSTPQGCALIADGRTNILEEVGRLVSHRPFLEAEIPASNGVASSRALARLFAAFGAGGTLDGVELLRPETLLQMREVQSRATDTVMSALLPWPVAKLLGPQPITLGFAANRKRGRRWLFGPNERSFGSAGFGGQIVIADPDAGLSIASVCTDFTPGLDKLTGRVLDAVYASLPAA